MTTVVATLQSERDRFTLIIRHRDGGLFREMPDTELGDVAELKDGFERIGFSVTVKNQRGIDVTRSF